MRGFRLTVVLALAGLLLAGWLVIGELRAVAQARDALSRQAVDQAAQALTRQFAAGVYSASRREVQILVGGQRRAVLQARVIDIQGRPLARASVFGEPASGVVMPLLRELVLEAIGREGRVRLVDDAGGGLGYLEFTRPDGLWVPPADAGLRTRFTRSAVLLALVVVGVIWLVYWLIAPPTRMLVVRREPTVDRNAPDPEAARGAPRHGAARWLQLMGDGVIVTDRRLQVRWMNDIAQTYTGWQRREARGQLIYSVFRPDHNPETALTPSEQALRRGEDLPPAEVRIVGRDGSVHVVEAAAGVLRSGDAVTGTVLIFRDLASQQARLADVRADADRAVAILGQLDAGIVTTNAVGVVEYANARAQRMFGYAADDMIGATVSKLLPVPFLNAPGVQLEDYVGNTGETPRPRVVGWRTDATTFPVELTVRPLERGKRRGYILALRDVSPDTEQASVPERLSRLLDSAGEEIYIFDAHSLYCMHVNRGAADNLGYERETLQRMTPLDLAPTMDERTFHEHLAALRSGTNEHVCYQTEHVRANGSRYPVEITLSFSADQEPPVFLAIAEEISARREAEAHLEFIAHHDALTGLPNRLLFMDRLEQAMLASRRTDRLLAVGFVDLDLFKRVNDTLGHDVGDELLKAVGERLLSCVRVSDTVARLAGDEYTLLMSGLPDRADVERLAHKILEAFSHPITIGDHDIVIGVSIGITLYPLDEVDARDLLRHADEAMYAVKRAGRGAFLIYEPELTPALERRLQIEHALRNAIALDDLIIVVTPVKDLERGQLAAARVGVRWSPPGIGDVSGDELVDAAQRTGLLQQLELRLLRGACELYASLEKNGRAASWPVMVALSTWQLRRRDFTLEVRELLERYNMPAKRLIIGLPEGGLLDVLEGVKGGGFDVLETMGVGFNIVDFGSGYQRLGRMSQFPVQFITLPAGIVDKIGDEAAAATLSTLLATASSLGARLIVPGVDDRRTADHLREVGCELAYGDAVGETVSAARFVRLAR